MACFGPLLLPPRPPPLPSTRSPGGRSPNSRLQRRRSSSTCRPPVTPLSSTYLSFRDDAEFEEVNRPPPPLPPPKPRAQFAVTLHRSASEGNLRNLSLSGSRTFNKCMRALSGSWKNLLQWHKDKPLAPPALPPLIMPPIRPAPFNRPRSLTPRTPTTLHLHAINAAPSGKTRE